MSNPGNPMAVPQPPLPDGHAPVEQAVNKAHADTAGRLGALNKAKSNITNIRVEMDKLSQLGDSVTPEDVIKGAGMVVSQGGDPMQLASLLADMPQGGQAIAGWLQQHDAQMRQNEAQDDQMTGQARHQAGSAALHVLAMDHIKQKFGAPQAAPTDGATNGLAP